MGRPQKFDREKVLRKAMELFWNKGFGATSMADLVGAMDLRPGSIYAEFGSKSGLLMAVIDFYGEESLGAVRETLQSNRDVRKGLDGLFQNMIVEMTAEEKPKGCLLLNVLLELSTIDDAAGARVRGHLSGIQDAIRDALKNAQEAGELSVGKKVHEAAVFLMGSIFSLRVMGRAKATRGDLDIIRQQSLAHVFA